MYTFRVSQRRDALPVVDAGDYTASQQHFELRVEFEPVADAIARIVGNFQYERGYPPRWLLLGWRTYLCLGWELGERRELLCPERFCDVELVVDEGMQRCIACLPPRNLVRFGGGR